MTTDVEATEAVMARCTAAGHAAATALASQKAKQATAPNALASAVHGRSILQLETVINQARLDILEAVTTLSVENKLFALFDALDRNGEGKIPLGDIDSGLRRIGGHSSFTTKVGLAADKLPVLDANGKCCTGQVPFAHFYFFCQNIHKSRLRVCTHHIHLNANPTIIHASRLHHHIHTS